MDIPYTREELRAATHETISRNGLKSCYIRPLVYRGAGPMGLFPLDCPVDVTIAVWEWGAYLGDEGKRLGVRGKVSSFRRISSDSVIPAAKATGQYVNSVLAKIEAYKSGYEEAILLDDRGMVCEGSGENLFFVKDGVIATPGFSADILGGINRASAITIARDLGYDGSRARRRARRALPRRRDLHDRYGGRAHAAARGRRPPGRQRRAGRGHAHDPARVRGRAARPLGALRRVARRRRRRPAPARRDAGSRSTTAPCATACRGRACRSRPARSCASRTCSTSSAWALMEAGFPASNPKEAELFELLARETFRHRGDRRLRDDPSARRRAPR